jgi:hypothetical protein
MLLDRGGVVGRRVAGVRSDAQPFVKDLHRRGGRADLDLLLRELVWHAVPVAIDLDVVVDVGACRCPLAVLVTLGGQRLQRGFVDLREEALA